MIEARIVGASASMLIHCGLLIAILLSSGMPAGKRPQAAGHEAAGEEEVKVRLLPYQHGEGSGTKCEHEYTGIGILHKRGEVSDVVVGGPADRAGMRVGDLIMEPQRLVRDGYSVGRVLQLQVLRNGLPIELRVRIEKICFELE